MDARRQPNRLYPRNYRGRPPKRGAYRPMPVAQRRYYSPVIQPSSHLQQTITKITTVGEYPLESNAQSSSETKQVKELNLSTSFVQSSTTKDAVEPMVKGQDVGTPKDLITAATESTSSNSNLVGMKRKIAPTPVFPSGDFINLNMDEPPQKIGKPLYEKHSQKKETFTLASKNAVLRTMEERPLESLSPIKSPFVVLSKCKVAQPNKEKNQHISTTHDTVARPTSDGTPTSFQKNQLRRPPLLAGEAFISLNANDYTEKRVHPSPANFKSRQAKVIYRQQIARPAPGSTSHQQGKSPGKWNSDSQPRPMPTQEKLPPKQQASLPGAKPLQGKIALKEQTSSSSKFSSYQKNAVRIPPKIPALLESSLDQKRMTHSQQIARPFLNLSSHKKKASNRRSSQPAINSRPGQKKILSGPKSNPSTSGTPHSKNNRPDRHTAPPLPSCSTPIGQKDITSQQQSRYMPHQTKIATNKPVSASQKKAAPNQGNSRPNSPSQKKILPCPRINPTISDSALHSKNITPNQQGNQSLLSSRPTPHEPSSSMPHQKKVTPNQQVPQIKSNPMYCKTKISPSQQTSPLISNSVALQEKTTPHSLIANETNLKKRKTPFSPPGDFISLDTTEPPHKKAKTVFQHDSFNGEVAASGERYYSQLPYTLTESRRLFMKDKGSSAIYDFFLQSQQSEVFLKKKQNLTSALEKVISEKLIPNCKMFLVGSSVNGFGGLTSDIDLCLVLDAKQETLTSRKRVMNLLHDIRRLLERAAFAKNLQVIPAKVPILKFRDALSGLHCDINVNNLTGIRNSELLRCYSILDHRVRPLVLVVKEWARQNKINDASMGTLSSYSLVLMVIHFLQCGIKPRLLPPLQQEYPHIFTTRTPVLMLLEKTGRINRVRSKNMMALFDLLLRFFEYFGKQFDFETQVMCVRLGTTRHVRNFQGFAQEWTKVIKIEEPFEQSNTARAVSCPEVARKILQKFRVAYETLRTRRRLDCLIKMRKSRDSVIILDD